MSFMVDSRLLDSPYIDTITHGHTTSTGSTTRPAEVNWHMVFVNYQGRQQFLVVGPWAKSGTVTFDEGAEILWLRFKLGTYMPHIPTKIFRNSETLLPEARRDAFWLKSSVWQFPNFDNAETFVQWLVRDEILVCDPVVNAVLSGRTQTHRPTHRASSLLRSNRIVT